MSLDQSMRKKIYEYCASRKEKGSIDPTWREIAQEVYEKFGVSFDSESLRRRVNEYRSSLLSLDVPPPIQWGTGRAKLVSPSTKETWEKVIFLSDIHAPYHDASLVAAVLDIIYVFEPHRVVLNGDINDFFGISRFQPNKAIRVPLLQEELDLGYMIRSMIRQAAPNAVIDETEGNHEERLIRYVRENAPSLSSLRDLEPDRLLRVDELEIRRHPRCGFLLREDFLVEHGHHVRGQAGATAKSRLDSTLISGIMGHTHRMGEHRRTGIRSLVWFEQGCLSLRSPDYIVGEPNWQAGFAYGYFHTKKPIWHVINVPALGQGFIFDGQIYGDIDSYSDSYSPD